MPTGAIAKFKRQTARRLRANATAAEKRLWRLLRQLPVQGTHFRRQVPIGPYIADFACLASRLVIELDGSQHAAPEQMAHDRKRTAWLESEGYRVIRFWNSEITDDRQAVLNAIHAALYGSADGAAVAFKHGRSRKADHPTPARVARRPSPSRGG